MALTRRKRIVFALVAMALSFFSMIVLLLAADLVVHYRAERSAGLNRYGYRGPVVPRKQQGELRVAMLGGSTVFGYGVAWNESVPAYLEQQLQARLQRPVRVVNLGYNNEGAFSFVPNLEDFSYLDYDVVVLYEGYNDLAGDENVNRSAYRRNSAIFRWVGYFPILPLYLQEKAKTLRYGDDLSAAYEAERRKSPVVFRPGLAQRTGATALEVVSSMTMLLDGQIDRPNAVPPPATKESESTLGCVFPYVTYCESVAAAVRFGRSRGLGVVVGSQPRLAGGISRERHTTQQRMLGEMIRRHFASDPAVVWADLSNAADLHDPTQTFDAMHLSPPANAVVATALIEPVMASATAAGIK